MGDDDDLSHSAEVAKGTFWGLAGTFFTRIIAFLYTIYIAYVVSQGDIGVFNLALGIVALLTVWKDFGLPTALVRYVPFFESRNEHGKALWLLKRTFAINGIAGIAVSAALWAASGPIAAFYANPPLGEALRLLSIFALLDNLQRVGSSFLQGRARISDIQLVGMAQVLSKFAFTFLLINAWGANFASLSVAYVASTVVAVLGYLPFMLKEAGRGRRGEEEIGKAELWGEIAPFGITLMIIQTFYVVISATDKTILGYLVPHALANSTVAVYSMAVSLAVNLMLLPGALGGIFLPIISRLVGKNDTVQIRRIIGTSQRWVLLITLPIAAVMIAFSSEMLSTFFGAEYAAGGATMSIFLAGLLFTVFSYTINLALAGMRQVKLELCIVFATAAINLALNLALIPRFGMEGAALASSASFAIACLAYLYYGKKVAGFESPSGAYRLVAAGIAVFALLLFIKPHVAQFAMIVPQFGPENLVPYISKSAYLAMLGIVSLLSFAVFGALALALRCFEKEDAAIMQKVAIRMRVPEKFYGLAEKLMQHGVEKK